VGAKHSLLIFCQEFFKIMPFISKKNVIIFTGALLIIGAAIYAAQWKWHFWKPAAVATEAAMPADSVPADEPIAAETADNHAGVKAVLSAYLFGREDAGKKPNPTEAVPKTQQPLELHGIVYIAKHPERSVALIAETGKAGKSYKIGDEIEPLPGWKVFLIAADGVQLEHDGAVELLELSRNFAAANSQQPGVDGMPADGSVVEAMPPEENLQPEQEIPPPETSEVPPPETAEVPPPENAEAPLSPEAQPPEAPPSVEGAPAVPEPPPGEEAPPPM
jgi:hypothetical protein